MSGHRSQTRSTDRAFLDDEEQLTVCGLRGFVPELRLEHRHALALASHHRGGEQHLLYCFWEPANSDGIPEVLAHRAEVAELVDRLGDDAGPRLHVRA